MPALKKLLELKLAIAIVRRSKHLHILTGLQARLLYGMVSSHVSSYTLVAVYTINT